MIVTQRAKEKFVKHCHRSWEKCKNEDEVEMKIKRMANLGKIHKYNRDGSYVVRYFDLNLHIKNDTIANIWKDVFTKKVVISEEEKKKWDRQYKRNLLKRKIMQLVGISN